MLEHRATPVITERVALVATLELRVTPAESVIPVTPVTTVPQVLVVMGA